MACLRAFLDSQGAERCCWCETSLQQAFSHARSAGAKAQKRQKDYYDARTTKPRFAINDKVRLHNPAVKAGTTKKFRKPWTGPYRVIEVIDDVVYRIEHCQTGKMQVVHVNRLKPVREDDTSVNSSADRPHPSPSAVSFPEPVVEFLQVPVVAPVAPVAPQHAYGLRNRNNIQPPARYR